MSKLFLLKREEFGFGHIVCSQYGALTLKLSSPPSGQGASNGMNQRQRVLRKSLGGFAIQFATNVPSTGGSVKILSASSNNHRSGPPINRTHQGY
ncbi:hypothetical protein PoB_003994600 [Plakobranchus ocellatus]|uniref:Uncharacterized protein n=1 Tax=Plakobranchus ocellatus TaxID=259542 RepID=A0AAV4B3P7_9GAST|nr:hypothetical protein PoB_003994600 [Plakobranchus ocellatus]